MPASLQNAMRSPANTRWIMRSACLEMVASSSRSSRFSISKCASSLPVTRVSSAHTTSAARNSSSVRNVISPKLPMGVGHKTSFPVEVFMGAIIPPDSACANDAAKAQKRLGQNARSSQALCVQVRLCASDQGLSSKASRPPCRLRFPKTPKPAPLPRVLLARARAA